MRKFSAFIFVLLLSSCSLLDFKSSRLSRDIEKEKQKICLNSDGRGRFLFNDQKHLFSYQGLFLDEEPKLSVQIDFPMYGSERVELEWNANKKEIIYFATYEQTLLKNTKNLDPAIFDRVSEMWVEFFEDLLFSKGIIDEDKNAHIEWNIAKDELIGEMRVQDKLTRMRFLNAVGSDYFGRIDFEIYDAKEAKEFGLELIVRKCLEKD